MVAITAMVRRRKSNLTKNKKFVSYISFNVDTNVTDSHVSFYFESAEHGLEDLCRNKKFDAHVCYDFDSNNDFVIDTILPELEKKPDPPFTLCIHSRDFTPGCIKDNIQEAIHNSNSAIVVMSQGFINSVWCKYEFEQCSIESTKDPAFKLFVIMIQPDVVLNNVSKEIERFFTSKIYLNVDDPKLFTNIGTYLTLVKQPNEMVKFEGEEIS